jgi:predicted nuclease with TOPRIM domain
MKYRVTEQNKKDRMNERQQETTALRKRNMEKERVVQGERERLGFLIGIIYLIRSLL